MRAVLLSHLSLLLGNDAPGNLMEANYTGTCVGATEVLLQLALSGDVWVIYTVCLAVSPKREEERQSLTYLEDSA